MLLADQFLGFEGPSGHVFEVVIQLGAILAVLVLYFGRLWRVLVGLPTDWGARRFVTVVLIAFLPAAFLGALLHSFIKSVLFSPLVVSIALIVGGLAILWIERHVPPAKHREVEDFTAGLAFKIGLCQCLALIPGVSRAGATILGAMLLGVERKAATEFSFFLAVPTMVGASALDLVKARHELTADGLSLIAVGFIVAFLSALVVVRWLIGFVSRHGFQPFAWYRIAVGVVMLAFLALASGGVPAGAG